MTRHLPWWTAPLFSRTFYRDHEGKLSTEELLTLKSIFRAFAAVFGFLSLIGVGDLEVWISEIKLRASVKIGELVRELEAAPHGGVGGGTKVPTEGLSKTDAIADAGLSKSTAHRLEQLAGPKDQRAQHAGKAAAETYFAKARQALDPPATDGQRGLLSNGQESPRVRRVA